MGIAAGDLIRLTDRQTYQGQEMLNVYYYNVESSVGTTTGYLESFINSWQTALQTAILNIQADATLHVALEAVNLTNAIDFASEIVNLPGNVPAAADALMPSFNCITFLLRRASLATRHGYKRYGGMVDGYASGNNVALSTTLTNPIRTGLNLLLTDSFGNTYRPIIVGRPIPDPAITYTYSLISGVDAPKVGTQNTRKAGRGS